MNCDYYVKREVGNLYVGDRILLAGQDITATVTGFDFSDNMVGHVGLFFEGYKGARLYATTDIVEVERVVWAD